MNANAASLGLASCHTCSLVSRVASDDALCPRCGSRVHLRKPGAIGQCWAFLIAAMILYVPANTLPMMLTSSLFGSSDDTIISGVLFLWEDGSWYLALIVFFASILVPIGKMLALLVLLLSVQLPGVQLTPERRARLARTYRIIDSNFDPRDLWERATAGYGRPL